ncbi:MAG TPA: TetR/AcrR family transcriptional regulator [Kribbella sp.]|uniref:TetR/AcrR family transcriptional regulator n=1 Tax=Kribbella sp. TaxID=1871183 RepID=UPI002D795542|nr:TetR/AcrR family transcriptional regulator [Kribbella sp.]HET6292316.1 TetR/AcrR family transcriptional regulator [Kribbella sp.]
MTTFQRARSEEQRAQRRQAILDTAGAMLTELPVAQLSLNELSRRVGLAKSNVLNYFESREAVLLELLISELETWTAELGGAVDARVDPAAPLPERAGQLTDTVIATLLARPMLCTLISAQAAVLEHNISTEAALAFKRGAAASYGDMIRAVLTGLPELGEDGAGRFIATAGLLAGALWTHAHPADAILAAYDTDPSLAPLRIEFGPALRDALDAQLRGLLTPWPT